MILYEDKALLVRASDDLVGPTCVVTFSHRRRSAFHPEEAGFSEAFLRKRGLPHVCFIAKQNHWWQVKALPHAMSHAWAAIAGRHDHVVTYGASMGGYGALLAASFFPVDSVIAFYPQTTINKDLVPDPRWVREHELLTPWYDALTYWPPRRTRVNVVYDPWQAEDRRHVDFLARRTRVTQFRAGLSGHVTLAGLNQMGKLGGLVTKLIAGPVDPCEFHRRFRRGRRHIPLFYQVSAELLAERGHAEMAEVYARQAKWLQGRRRRHAALAAAASVQP